MFKSLRLGTPRPPKSLAMLTLSQLDRWYLFFPSTSLHRQLAKCVFRALMAHFENLIKDSKYTGMLAKQDWMRVTLAA
jgi:hypothetical protein